MVKLTEPQWDLLTDACGSGASCAPDYKPLIKLLDLGFVTKRVGKYGHVYVNATDAGRAALQEAGR